jgi:hypothetical protein
LRSPPGRPAPVVPDRHRLVDPRQRARAFLEVRIRGEPVCFLDARWLLCSG